MTSRTGPSTADAARRRTPRSLLPGRLVAVTGLVVVLLAASGSGSLAAPAEPTTPIEWVRAANAAYEEGDFRESSRAFGHAIEGGAGNPTTFYNAACSASLAGEVDLAFERLELAVAHGWRDVDLTAADGDLDAMRADPRWEEAFATVRAANQAFRASLGAPDLRDELLAMRRVDQAARGVGTDGPDPAEMMAVDSLHTARMKAIVDEHGWPTRDLVGEDGARAAWLLVQHADRHPEFQRRCLELMKASAPGQVGPLDVAYLTDRVLVNEGKLQVYATQFWTVDGALVPRPIQEPAKVESLRAAVGMTSMQDYHQRMTGRDWEPGE